MPALDDRSLRASGKTPQPEMGSAKEVAEANTNPLAAESRAGAEDSLTPVRQEPDERPNSPAAPAHIDLSLVLPPGTQVRLTVETISAEDGHSGEIVRTVFTSPAGQEDGSPFVVRLPLEGGSASNSAAPSTRFLGRRRSLVWPFSLAATLFAMGLFIYLATRFIGLTQFPIYFFTDEAIQVVLAADFVRDNFHNYAGEFFPAFFENGGKYRLGTTVYLHILPYLLFGKSVWLTRATAVLVTSGAVLALAYIARNNLRTPYWWSTVLFLSITPTWFLHSRTAFEYSAAVSFYALALYFYLRYRDQQPRSIFPALIFGALAFYTYSPYQAIVPVSGLLILAIDWNYHRRQWQETRYVPMVAFLLALPYIRFLLVHPAANWESLSALGSYWLDDNLTIVEKFGQFAARYGLGLSPAYWFDQTPDELIRHYMKGYSHLPLLTFPLVAMGLWVTIRKAFSGEQADGVYRVILVVLLAIPTGAALVQVGVTRLLAMVLPAVLLSVIGVSAIFQWLEKRGARRAWLAVSLFLILAISNVALLRDALENGPTWFQEYGMNGMQYGAIQVFDAVEEFLVENPESRVIFSPIWANGADVLARFMLGDPLPVEIGSVIGHLHEKKPLDENTLFVLTPEEYQQAVESQKFSTVEVLKTLPYPNGEPGFYFTHMQYVPEIDAILAAERAARRALVPDEVNVDGAIWQVRHSIFDIGEVEYIFDDRPDTLVRTMEANPLLLFITFPEPRMMENLDLVIGSARIELTVSLYLEGKDEPVKIVDQIDGTVSEPGGRLVFGQPYAVRELRLQIHDLDQTEPGQVHLWELSFEQ